MSGRWLCSIGWHKVGRIIEGNREPCPVTFECARCGRVVNA